MSSTQIQSLLCSIDVVRHYLVEKVLIFCDQLMVEQLFLYFENEFQGLIELLEILCLVLNSAEVLGYLVMMRRINVNDIVLQVEAVNLVAASVVDELPRSVI